MFAVMSNENQFAKVEIHLEKFASNRRNVAQCCYKSRRIYFPWEIAKLSFDIEKETRTSGTYRCQIQNVHKSVKFLSPLMEKYGI